MADENVIVSEYDDPELVAELGADDSADVELPLVRGDGQPAEQDGGEPAGDEPADDAAWRAHLNPGETEAQAIERLAQENSEKHGWATRVTSEMRELRAELRQQQQRFQPIIEGLSRAHQARLEQQRRAQEPDPEAEPDRAILHEIRQLREERQQEREEAAKTAQARAIHDFDSANLSELVETLRSDQEFASAHDAMVTGMYRELELDHPDADPEALLEVVQKMETLYLRQLRERGVPVVEGVKARASKVFGWQPQRAAAAPAGGGEVSKLRRHAAKREAARGATALGGSVSRQSAPAGDLDSMTDEDLFFALESGAVSEKDLLAGMLSTLS